MSGDFFTALAYQLRKLAQNKKALVGSLLLLIVVVVAVSAPLLTPYAPETMHVGPYLQSPNWSYPLGTDRFGRDGLTRIIFGARVSLSLALEVCAFSVFLGVPPGLLAGYRHGAIDNLLMALADLLFTIPSVLMALFIAAILGPGLDTVRIALTVVYTPQFLRLSRGVALSTGKREFVTAARALGAGDLRIIARHVLPNCVAPILIQVALVMSYVVLAEATLSYLGIGTQPPTPSWGVMLREGVEQMYSAPYLPVFPGLAVTYLVLSFNLLGDGLRDILDPYFRGRG